MFARLRGFRRQERGAAAFEAVFFVLFLSFMMPPTFFLMRFTEAHLHASWLQRSAARNHAQFGNCSGFDISAGGAISYVTGVMVHEGHKNTTLVRCGETQIDTPANDRFWRVAENAVRDNGFPTLVDDLKNEGDFEMHTTARGTVFHEFFELGDPGELGTSLHDQSFVDQFFDLDEFISDLPTDLRVLVDGMRASSFSMAPSTEYYRWDEVHWREGHDKAVWARIPQDARDLYPRVFPSK